MAAPAGMPTPPGRRPRKAVPSKRPLSQDLIVGTAIGVLDAEGLDAVSMRRVAQELGTGPASLYAHVSGKDELRELMLDRVAGEIRVPEIDPDRWQEQLKDLAREVRRVWGAHADIARVSLALIPTGPNLLRLAEFQLAVMRAGGVPPRIAALAVDTLGAFIDADSVENTLYAAKTEDGQGGTEHFLRYIAEIREYFKALPAERYPNVVAMVDDLTDGDGDERFEFGLDIFIRGIGSYVEQ
ncbi:MULTISPECIES: TetR/AcrR family transcriptional regulator [Thermomonosporaceae]|uniref:TetR/AcrR family transcriptional regulator n=1 Tax=Thermomonosporaceae TaxID=2012 RepID=UPI00255B33C1|nr:MULTISPECIES: TetR/AcrR family transcriptional regulator [Thermomonosporaceae]MDL4774946.1 TetR/AcrR family transcriptional regulator [Actinomadura xylanilytica]